MMNSRRAEPSQQARNAEDNQPNEARGRPKGAGIPVVHAPPKSGGPKQRPHHGRGDVDGSWRGKQGNKTEGPAERMQFASHRPIPQPPRIGANAPFGAKGETSILRSQHPLPSNPYKRQKIVDVASDSVANYDASLDRKEPRKRKRKAPPARDWQTMVVDAPENCQRGAPHSGKRRGEFIRDFTHGLKSNMGAIIKNIAWKVNQVVIEYAIDEKRPKSDLAESSSKAPRCSIEDDEAKQMLLKIPSGLDVKLDDKPFEPEPSPGPRCSENIIKSDDLDDAVSPPMSERPHLSTYRPFESGVLTLTYGPPRVATTDLPSTTSTARGEDVNLTDARHEVPDIIDLTFASISDEGEDEQLDIQDAVMPIPINDDDMTDLLQEQKATGWRDKSFYITEDGDGVPLPRHNHDKPRRLLVSEALDKTYVLSLHGRIQELTRSPPREQNEISVFDSAGTKDHSVDDACLLNSPFHHLAIVGQTNEDNALTLVDLSDNMDRRISKLPRSSLQSDRLLRGVSAVHALPSNSKPRFIAGGYDHTVELWTVDESLSSASSSSLAIHHQSTIYSLTTMKDTPLKIVSAGADCIVNIWDITSERTVKCLRTSNMVYHVHPTDVPGCVFFEVSHRDSQFELHDYRAHIGRPSLRFGFVSPAVNGRYMKGDIRGNTFVCGDRNGTVRQWDFRSTKEPLQRIEIFPGQKIVQTAFDGDALAIVPEDNRLLFLDVKEVGSSNSEPGI